MSAAVEWTIPTSAPVFVVNANGNRMTEPSPWIGCPVCGVVTIEARFGGVVVRMLDTASGHQDGARCGRHARTVEERAAESERALRIISRRLVSRGVLAWVDDTAQGTE